MTGVQTCALPILKAEKERDEAEQHGYDVGVAETKDTLRAEVPHNIYIYIYIYNCVFDLCMYFF